MKKEETSKKVEVTKEEKEKFLEDLILKGGTTYKTNILDGKLEIVFATLTAEQKDEISDIVEKYKETTVANYISKYNKEILYRALIGYNKEDLRILENKDRREKIQKIPDIIFSRILKEYNLFSSKLEAVCNGEEIKENFLEDGLTS